MKPSVFIVHVKYSLYVVWTVDEGEGGAFDQILQEQQVYSSVGQQQEIAFLLGGYTSQ